MNDFSGLVIGGTNSNCGKTTVTLALLSALARRGLVVQPFKCGPDYIDPTFHHQAAGRVSANLDGWMTGRDGIINTYRRFASDADVAVIEGVMGLFDGLDGLAGSTAEVAVTLELPVILVVNARGMAGSISAMVSGYVNWLKELKIAGVIANNTGSERHSAILAQALGDLWLGCLPRHDEWVLPERHLGLVPFQENRRNREWFKKLGEAAENNIDIDKILERTRSSRPKKISRVADKATLRLAVARDEAFGFYYEENLAVLRENGIELVEFSPLRDKRLPEGVNGIYLGGGFPEIFAAQLTANLEMLKAIRGFKGLIYAECGGYMYLMEEINGEKMVGLVPASVSMSGKLRSLGYREVNGPFGNARGHEFHYSHAAMKRQITPLWSCANGDTGFHEGNVYAGYVHVHWGNNPEFVVKFKEKLACSGTL